MRTGWLLLSLLLCCGSAQADKIYRWVGADNRVYFGDTPPAGARDVRPFVRKVGTGMGVGAEAGPGQPFDPDAEASHRADCTRKQAQLVSYRNATRLVERDSLGREREYSEEERALLIEKTEAQLAAQCAGFEIAEQGNSP